MMNNTRNNVTRIGLAAAAVLTLCGVAMIGQQAAASRVTGQEPGTTATFNTADPGGRGVLSAVGSAVDRVVTTPERSAEPDTRSIKLTPVTAFYSQATIDRGKLVTWMTSPVCLLAGHDSRGWNWLDDIATGTVVVVTVGPCSGRYMVYGHKHQSRKGGPIPAWMSAPGVDLVLQTCTGWSGMGFSLARRV